MDGSFVSAEAAWSEGSTGELASAAKSSLELTFIYNKNQMAPRQIGALRKKRQEEQDEGA